MKKATLVTLVTFSILIGINDHDKWWVSVILIFMIMALALLKSWNSKKNGEYVSVFVSKVSRNDGKLSL